MAITVDWAQTHVIFIPKADMVQLSPSPHEVRELDLNAFRLTLRDLEEDVDGRPWPKTHNHNTEESLGGLLFARQVKILAPYTVTFEDGQYRVNAVGANSNIADVQNFNQVSVSTFNSAGLVVVSGGGSLTKQDVRDAQAMDLTPGVVPTAESIDGKVETAATLAESAATAAGIAADKADVAAVAAGTAAVNAADAVIAADAAADAAGTAAIAAGTAADKADTAAIAAGTAAQEAAAGRLEILHAVKIESGSWELLDNQMIFYDEDDVTPLVVFDLFNAAGQPAMTDVVKRVRHV